MNIFGCFSHQAGDVVKKHGKPNDLKERIQQDPFFVPVVNDLDVLFNPKTFIGRAPEQVEEFWRLEVTPALEPYEGSI